ncbi:cytochrome P450 [Coniochaeta ligniaria NRRL 30616]|uniref:Cytochrome P450 n=1 Tax=Coniochaeta ligniaria NRRL 30616 TaxID=1408157 RepID=A0A1J7J3P8_9PEZI|nr:cytochrome P450 [Coniochaeta ligniaria NRRL 30616]
MDVLLLQSAAVILTLYLILYRLQATPRHPNEPSILPSRLPFLGPLVGMALQGGHYLKHLGLRHRHLPIFTLPVPFSRLYIVTDPSLAAAVQRASRTLSFTPLVPDITRRVLGLDAATVEVVSRRVDEPGGFLTDVHDMVYAYLGPGRDLERLSLAAGRELSEQVARYVEARSERLSGGGEVRGLLVWIRHFVAQGTGRLLYGESNPLASSADLEDAFWDFDHGLGGLLAGVLPRLTARKAYRGREKLVATFEGWIRAGRHEGDDVPDIIRERLRIAKEHGVSIQAAARSEVSFLFAGIVNTATTTFWTVLQVFARRELLDEVRDEVGRCMEGGELSLEKLKTACPNLLAVVRECLRLGSDTYSVRLVKTDTELAGGRYMLKAGSVVQIAGGVIHADQGIWGDDVDVFDHTRFLKAQQTDGNGHAEEGQGRPQVQQMLSGGVHPAAFRAFGGGKTLCPGRHFAINEILAFVAVILLTFDIEAADGSGRIKIPKKNDGVLPVHILEPVEPVMVRIRVRENAPRVAIV